MKGIVLNTWLYGFHLPKQILITDSVLSLRNQLHILQTLQNREQSKKNLDFSACIQLSEELHNSKELGKRVHIIHMNYLLGNLELDTHLMHYLGL